MSFLFDWYFYQSNGVRQAYLALDLCRQHIATHASLETMEHSTVNFVSVN